MHTTSNENRSCSMSRAYNTKKYDSVFYINSNIMLQCYTLLSSLSHTLILVGVDIVFNGKVIRLLFVLFFVKTKFHSGFSGGKIFFFVFGSPLLQIFCFSFPPF